MNDLELLSDDDLALASGGLAWEGHPQSNNIEDLRTPLVIETTGDFARFDRELDAINEANPYAELHPITTQGELRAYDEMMVALDKQNDDYLCSNVYQDISLDLSARPDIDTAGEFQRWDKTDSPGGYDGNRGNDGGGFQPTDFNAYADAGGAVAGGFEGGDFGGGDFGGFEIAQSDFGGGGGGGGGSGGSGLYDYMLC